MDQKQDKKLDKKKLAAAMAAVFACIKTNEEAAASQIPAGAGMVPQGQALPGQPLNLWGMTGRQTLMQASAMMQLRMFK